MTYQVLARKWRPQDFSSLVGQEPIVTALRNALREQRIAQAYVFSGIRGVGKTTAARVLAKALNCEKGLTPGQPAVDPCNECGPCKDITSGHDLDVLEVDAATYSKVEQVRELTESLRYGAAKDRYKVVVLDEVHRLSRQAFDALLKIVEEPPPHLVFIFATTELDAVPATILSRCQEFQFRRVPSGILAEHLRRISDAEKIEVSDPALRMIARAGEGSVRDSVALLDQFATFGNGTISDQDAKNLLGGLDAAIFIQLLEAILTGNRLTISDTVREIEANGWDPHNVYGQFLTFTRDALQLAVGGSTDSVDLPKEEAESLAVVVQQSSCENLLRVIQLLLASEASMRRSEFGALSLQITWLRAAELPKIVHIQDLLSGKAPMPSELSAPSGSTPPDRPQSAAPSSTRRAAAPPSAKSPQPTPSADIIVSDPPAAGLRRSASPTLDPSQSIPRLLDEISAHRPSLAPLLKSQATEISLVDGRLEIPNGDQYLVDALDRETNRRVLEDAIESTLGAGILWGWKPAKARKQPATATKASSNKGHQAKNLPKVQAVLDVFGGKIQSIETHLDAEPPDPDNAQEDDTP